MNDMTPHRSLSGLAILFLERVKDRAMCMWSRGRGEVVCFATAQPDLALEV
jgi:hypothetical protein